MANTINYEGFTIQITSIDSDWSWSDTLTGANFANGVAINFIQFNPAATNDKCSIKEKSDTGPESFYVTGKDADNQKRAYYHGAKMKPVLDYSEGVFTAGSSVIIQLWRDAPH